MKSEDKISVLMFSMSTWQEWQCGIVNRNYFIYQQMFKDERIAKILFIDYLPFSFRRGFKYLVQNNLGKIKGETLSADLASRLVKVSDKTLVYSTNESVISINRTLDKISGILGKYNFKDLLLWSYLPTYTEYLGKFAEKQSIFDAVDNWSLHPSYHKIKKRLEANYQTISQKSDHVFTVSRELTKLFPDRSTNFIPNGVDYDHFQNWQKPSVLKKIKSKIIGYIGTIQSRVDISLLRYLAEQNPDKTILLLGPVWPDSGLKQIKHLSNLISLGRIPYGQSANFLNEIDCGIIPHKPDRFSATMNPMKIYEYLACGKPVVSSYDFGLDYLSEYIKVADNYQKFNQAVNQELDSDNPAKAEKRQQTAQANSWDNRYRQMWQIIENKQIK